MSSAQAFIPMSFATMGMQLATWLSQLVTAMLLHHFSQLAPAQMSFPTRLCHKVLAA